MQARQLPARHGVLWLIAGFALFRRNPPLLTALTFGYLFIVILVNVLPLVGPFLLPLALPALTVIIGNGCRAIEQGGRLDPPQLLRGLSANRVALLRLGGLHLVGSLAVLAISVAIEGGDKGLTDLGQADPAIMLGVLGRLLAIASPVLMAFWFAPLLTGWDAVPAAKSVFFSFVASLRNWRAFAAYGLAAGLVAVAVPGLILIVAGTLSQSLLEVLAVALRMLLVFVVAPVLLASVYLSYRDVFHGTEEEAAAAVPAAPDAATPPPDA